MIGKEIPDLLFATLRPGYDYGTNSPVSAEAKYQHESVTDVLGLSVTDVPVHTADRIERCERDQA